MEEIDPMNNLLPVLIYAAAVIAITVGMLLLSNFLGERHSEKATPTPFEAGVKPTGSARLHFPIHFYIVAMFFVIFDLEAVFIIAWAVSLKQTAWPGYIAMLIFAVELAVLIFYLIKIGALNFGPDSKAILKAYHNKRKTQKL